MSEDKNKYMPLFGAVALIALTGALTYGAYSMNNDCDDEYNQDYDGINNRHMTENYCNSGYSVPPPEEAYVPPPFHKENFNSNMNDHRSINNYATGSEGIPVYNEKTGQMTERYNSDSNVSPMGFSEMAGESKMEEEGYNFDNNSGLSDYVNEQDYGLGGQNIPVYNPKDGQVGLPVPDMSDISAGENNKYVYDRTIGTVGFTSTKIGGRRRGQADYVRGFSNCARSKQSFSSVC